MSNIDKAAEVICSLGWDGGDAAQIMSESLAVENLLMPDGVTEEWEAVVAWRNRTGQTEQQHGRGVTRDEALDDARAKQHWLTDPTEIAHKCAVRHVTPWETEELTYTEKDADDE